MERDSSDSLDLGDILDHLDDEDTDEGYGIGKLSAMEQKRKMKMQMMQSLMQRIDVRKEKNVYEMAKISEDLLDESQKTGKSALKPPIDPNSIFDLDEADKHPHSIFAVGPHGELNVTLKGGVPMTDKAKQLSTKIDKMTGNIHAVGANAKPRKRTRDRHENALVDQSESKVDQRTLQEMKRERQKFEKILADMARDKFVTHTVTDYRYIIPEEDDDSGSYQTAESSSISYGHWPIPIEREGFNPARFLAYTCSHIIIPSGAGVLKHFVAKSHLSKNLFPYMFWFISSKFFQVSRLSLVSSCAPNMAHVYLLLWKPDSAKEQEYLLNMVSQIYVKMMDTRALEGQHDLIMKWYPFCMAHVGLPIIPSIRGSVRHYHLLGRCYATRPCTMPFFM